MRILRRFVRTFLLICVVAIVGLLFLRGKYHDVIMTLAQTQVKNVTSDLINDFRSVLMISISTLGVNTSEGMSRPRIRERPLTPPVEKLLGNLKK